MPAYSRSGRGYCSRSRDREYSYGRAGDNRDCGAGRSGYSDRDRLRNHDRNRERDRYDRRVLREHRVDSWVDEDDHASNRERRYPDQDASRRDNMSHSDRCSYEGGPRRNDNRLDARSDHVDHNEKGFRDRRAISDRGEDNCVGGYTGGPRNERCDSRERRPRHTKIDHGRGANLGRGHDRSRGRTGSSAGSCAGSPKRSERHPSCGQTFQRSVSSRPSRRQDRPNKGDNREASASNGRQASSVPRQSQGDDDKTQHGEIPQATVTMEIVDGVTRVTGDKTYQAQIYVPRVGAVHSLNPGQKPPTVCIRGPSRVDKHIAEDDGQKFKTAFEEGGIQELRRVRATLTGRGGCDVKA